MNRTHERMISGRVVERRKNLCTFSPPFLASCMFCKCWFLNYCHNCC
ncbi:hypothetical protein NC651_033371 [Populus alba x Populus x berolinensis]|nr:hypothetical protein NC651_033371 [Populus alba x Populus x berolinensis]